jgi:hypothetical protein
MRDAYQWVASQAGASRCIPICVGHSVCWSRSRSAPFTAVVSDDFGQSALVAEEVSDSAVYQRGLWLLKIGE